MTDFSETLRAYEALAKRAGINLLPNKQEDITRLGQNILEKWSPERWRQEIARRWYLHEYSWYMFEESQEYILPPENRIPSDKVPMNSTKDFCSAYGGCIEHCGYHPSHGRTRLEYSDIQKAIKGLDGFPYIKEARAELDRELKQMQQGLEESRKQNSIPRTTLTSLGDPQEETLNSKPKPLLFKVLEAQPFWIWHRHLHLQQFLMTQGLCCFNHIIGEPEKYGKLMPIF